MNESDESMDSNSDFPNNNVNISDIINQAGVQSEFERKESKLNDFTIMHHFLQNSKLIERTSDMNINIRNIGRNQIEGNTDTNEDATDRKSDS